MCGSITGNYKKQSSLILINMDEPLLIFSDDWGRHPSSCQYLIRELLPTRKVIWVNTIGTRPPRLNLATVKRAWGKLRQWSNKNREASELHPNLTVLNPRMWPGFSNAWQRKLNCKLLLRQLMPVIQRLSTPSIVVSTIPIVADIIKELPRQSFAYYCVDDFSVWPGLDGTTLGAMETKMLPLANTIISASEHLQQRLLALGYPSKLLTHGVDLDFWTYTKTDQTVMKLFSFEKPWVVFWGVVDRRMDVEYVQHLSCSLQTGSIILAGPTDEPDSKLQALKNVYSVGSLKLSQLPILANEAAVLMMPYADLPVTRAMQPLKLKEYLATGKPVVASNLPANLEWQDCLDIARSPDEFVEKVKWRIQKGISEQQKKARVRLSHESWKSKAELFAHWLSHDKNSVSPSSQSSASN